MSETSRDWWALAEREAPDELHSLHFQLSRHGRTGKGVIRGTQIAMRKLAAAMKKKGHPIPQETEEDANRSYGHWRL